MALSFQSPASIIDDLKNGSLLIAFGYMFYACWDSMERTRYLIAYQGAGEIPILWSPAFLTVALLCGLASFLVQKGIIESVYIKALRIVVPVIGSVSSIVLCLQRLAGDTPNPILIASFGLCIAWYILVWAERFGDMGGWKTFSIILVADAGSAILQFVFVQTMGSAALLTTTALLPLLTSLLLQFSPRVDSDDSLKEKSPSFQFSWILPLAIMVFGMLYFLLRSVLYIHPYSFVNSAVVPIGSLTTLALLFALSLFVPHNDKFARLFIPASLTFAAIIFILAIILMPFVKLDALWSVLVVSGNRVGFIMLILGLSQVAYQRKIRPTAVFGLGFAALYLGYSIGGFIGVNIAQYSGSITGLLMGCSLLALICIGLAFAWLFMTDQLPFGKGEEANEALAADSAVNDLSNPSLDSNLTALGSTSNVSPQGGEQKSSFDVLFGAAVQEVANEHSLSKREAEILGYVARGRSSTYISETLFISPNTTKKHIQHIYRKLDIHSNQEIIDLVETAMR